MEHIITFADPGAGSVIRDLQIIVGLLNQIRALGGSVGFGGVGGGGGGVGRAGGGGGVGSTTGGYGVTRAIAASRFGETEAENNARQAFRLMNRRMVQLARLPEPLPMLPGGDTPLLPMAGASSPEGGIPPGLWYFGNVGGTAGRKPEFGGFFRKWGQAEADALDPPVRPGAWSRWTRNFRSMSGWQRGLRRIARRIPGIGRYAMRIGRPALADVIAQAMANSMIATAAGESELSQLRNEYQLAKDNARRFGISPRDMLADLGQGRGSGNFPWYTATDFRELYEQTSYWMGEGLGVTTYKKQYQVETALAKYASAWNNQGAYDAMAMAAYDDPMNNPRQYLKERYKEHYGAKPKGEAHRSTLTIFARTAKGA